MTTYYGVWTERKKTWMYFPSGELFHTEVRRLAVAQAKARNHADNFWTPKGEAEDQWEARVIGEDGLPVEHAVSLSEINAKLMQGPEFRAEYEALESEGKQQGHKHSSGEAMCLGIVRAMMEEKTKSESS